MKPEINQNTPKEYIGKLVLFWYAVIGSIAFFAIVTLYLSNSPEKVVQLSPDLVTKITFIISCLGVGQIVAAFILNMRLNSMGGVDHFLSGKGITAIKVNLPPPDKLDDIYLALALLPHYFQTALITWALVAVVAFYGLILTIFCGATSISFLFYFFSALAMVLFRTSESGLYSLVTHARDIVNNAER